MESSYRSVAVSVSSSPVGMRDLQRNCIFLKRGG